MTPDEVRRAFMAEVDLADLRLRDAELENRQRLERLRHRVGRYRAWLASDPKGDPPERPLDYPDTLRVAEEQGEHEERSLRRALASAENRREGALRALEMLGL